MRRALAIAAVLGCLAGVAFAQGAASPTATGAPSVAEQETMPSAPPLKDGQPAVPSFQKGSGTRAGGPANELNTGDRRASETYPGGNVGAAISGRELYHGNFCGRGNRGANLAPTDELDAACKRHDECWDRAGRRSCACNAALRREAHAVSELKTASRELRTRAASVIQAAEAMGCDG